MLAAAAARQARSGGTTRAAAARAAAAPRPGRGRGLLAHALGGPAAPAAAAPAAAAGEGVQMVLSKRAAERLLALQRMRKNPALHLRLAVEGGGCSGFSYIFTVEDATKPEDRVFEHHGARLVVDDISLDLVKGSTVDFTENLIRRSFEVLNNPNAESGCGCGSSFAAKQAAA
jgi:iron-sulfur cluster assembly accessory protein